MALKTDRKAAKAAGDTFYQGINCPGKHGGKRYTQTGHCPECRREVKDNSTSITSKGRYQSARELKSDPMAFKHQVAIVGNPDRVNGR